MLMDKVGRVEERLDESEQQLEQVRKERDALQKQQQNDSGPSAEIPPLDRLSMVAPVPVPVPYPPAGVPAPPDPRSFV